MTRPTLLLALLLLPACTVGTRQSSFARPGGEQVTLSLGHDIELRGELLTARNEGLLLLTSGIFEVPWSEIESASFERLGDVDWRARSIPGDPTIEKLRLVSRFPQGLEEPTTRRLLDAYGQESVRICRVVEERLACEAEARSQVEPLPDQVVAVVRAATARYRDRAQAEADGYRRIGPDIPAMGEHWVNVRLLLDPAVERERPEILAYVPVDGQPRLVGVAWAVALSGEESPPEIRGVPSTWHSHDGPVEEELLQVGHAGHAIETGTHVAVVHAWVWTPSPAGTYAAENWSLPALRLGLDPEFERDDEAARALSLARGGHEFLARQTTLLAKLDIAASEKTARILADAGAAVEKVLAGVGPGGLSLADRRELAAIWSDARSRIAAAVETERQPMIAAILGPGSEPE